MTDAASGISATLDWASATFANVEFTVSLLRPPRGEWLGMDATTHLGGPAPPSASPTCTTPTGRWAARRTPCSSSPGAGRTVPAPPPVGDLLALTPLTDLSVWVRGRGLEVVLILIGSVLLARFAQWIGARMTGSIDRRASGGDALVRSEAAKHRHSLTQVLTWTAIVLIYAIAAFLVLDSASASRSPGWSRPRPCSASGLGFGAQRVVSDVLAGFFIITERQYGFGDVVRDLGRPAPRPPPRGTVEDVTLRITRLRSANGEVVTVSNGQIVKVVNLSRDWARAVVDVPVPVTSDINRVNEILREVGRRRSADASLRGCCSTSRSVMGVESLDLDQVNVRMVARTLPGKQFEVGRDLRARVVLAFRRQGMTLPPAPADHDADARGGAAVTTPAEEQPAAGPHATPEQAAAGVPGTPQVTTAPPRARWRMGRVPPRLGRARTSTVVLAVGWLLVALLWLDVRPPSAQIVPTSGTDAGTVAPATTAPARTAHDDPPDQLGPGGLDRRVAGHVGRPVVHHPGAGVDRPGPHPDDAVVHQRRSAHVGDPGEHPGPAHDRRRPEQLSATAGTAGPALHERMNRDRYLLRSSAGQDRAVATDEGERPLVQTRTLTRRSAAAVAALASAALVVSGCGSSSSGSGSGGGAAAGGSSGASAPSSVAADPSLAAKVPASIKTDGVISVGSDTTYAPSEFLAADGKTIQGFDVDLFNAGRRRSSASRPTFQTASFDSIIAGVQSQKYEIGVSSFTVNTTARGQVNMVSYFSAGTQWADQEGQPEQGRPRRTPAA